MKTLLKQSKLNEKLILNEDEDILLDDEENIGESKIFNTEDRIKELEAIKKEKPLTDEELEELAYCKNEVDSRNAETRYLNGESLKKPINESIEYFVVEIPDMSVEDAISYKNAYGLRAKKKGNSILMYGDEELIEEMLKDYLGRWDKIGPIMSNGYYETVESLKEAKEDYLYKILDKNYEEIDRVGGDWLEALEKLLNNEKAYKIIYTATNGDDYDYCFKDDNNNIIFSTYFKDENKILNKYKESLKEDIEEEDDLLELEEPIDEEPIENIEIDEPIEPVTQEVADNAYLTQLNDLITSEYGKIDEVKSLIATFDSEDAIEKNNEVISILNAFIDETTISIGMLTKATELIDSTTNDLMKQGIEKAEDAIKNIEKETEEVEESLKESKDNITIDIITAEMNQQEKDVYFGSVTQYNIKYTPKSKSIITITGNKEDVYEWLIDCSLKNKDYFKDENVYNDFNNWRKNKSLKETEE